MRTFLLLLLSFFATNVVLFAQSGYSSGVNNFDTNTPEINSLPESPEINPPTNIPDFIDHLDLNCDTRLTQMLNWHIQKNKNKEGIDGFRVEIFFSSEINAKNQALKIKADFMKEHPGYPVHVKFITPNFRVRIGDFRTKNEALKLYKLIQKDYPTAFIVPDIIDFPLLKTK